MKKESWARYIGIFRIGLQSALVYRWNFCIRAFFSVISLTVAYLLWSTAYKGRAEIAGFTPEQTFSYFLILLLVNYCVSIFDEDALMSEEIRSGQMNQWVVRPVNYYAYRLLYFTSKRIVTGSVMVLPALALGGILRHKIFFTHQPLFWVYFFPALGMSFFIQFSLSFILASSSFWIHEVRGLLMLFFAFSFFLSGQNMPLDLVPQPYFNTLLHLPFFYQLYFPVALLSERLSPETATYALKVQAVWTLGLIVLAHLVWNRGLKRYTGWGT